MSRNGAIMNITVKDVPAELHERLRSVADETGRSFNKLILITLERALVPQKIDRDVLLRRIRVRRARMTLDSCRTHRMKFGRRGCLRPLEEPDAALMTVSMSRLLKILA